MRFVASIDLAVQSRAHSMSNAQLTEFMRVILEREIKYLIKHLLAIQHNIFSDVIEVSVMDMSEETVIQTTLAMELFETQLTQDNLANRKNYCTTCNCIELAHKDYRKCLGNANGPCERYCRAYTGKRAPVVIKQMKRHK